MMNKTERRQLAATVYSDHPHNRLDTVKEWLNANYVVKVNLLDRSKVSLEPTEECTFRYEYPVTESDILLHAFAEEIKISEKNLRMLLASPNQMHSFNPIKDYLESLLPLEWFKRFDCLSRAFTITSPEVIPTVGSSCHYFKSRQLRALSISATSITFLHHEGYHVNLRRQVVLF